MYFDTTGKSNTRETIARAVDFAQKRGVQHIVVASNTGDTALLLKDCGINCVCITHAQGFVHNGKNEMSAGTREELEASGMRVLTTSHVLSGAERGLSSKLGGIYPAEIIANTLRFFGQGTKVAVEVSVMALDAGLVPYGVPIIGIGGTGRGADTALLLQPAHAQHILETKIYEIICKPGEGGL